MEGLGYPCVFGIDFLNFLGTNVDFIQNIVIFENLVEAQTMAPLIPEPKWDALGNFITLGLSSQQQHSELKALLQLFGHHFSDEPGVTNVISYAIHTGDAPLVKGRPYRYYQ